MALHPNWKSLSTVAIPWKKFIREGESYIPQKKKKVPLLKQNLTGDEAKELYEEIVKSETKQHYGKFAFAAEPEFDEQPDKLARNRDKDIHNHVEPKTPHEVDKNNWTNKLMKAAQANDIAVVSALLEESPQSSINTVDQFGWTALMCAAASGSLEVVKFLLQKGADISVKDKSGKCCLSIARRMKKSEIIDCIKLTSKFIMKEKSSVCAPNPIVSSSYCDVCKRNFSDEMDKHITSTVHLFNSHPGGSKTFYSIPESNRGFQILLKAGWDKERGLGPEGCGNKFPLKTVLRRDRRGLGQPDKKQPRVTHFDALSNAAVRTERKSKGKKERENNRLREKRKERMLRNALN